MTRARLVMQAPIVATLVVLCGLYVACGMENAVFFGWDGVRGLLMDNAVLGLISIGMTFVIVSGGIDLSVGAAIGMSSIMMAVLVHQGVHPLPAGLVVLAATALGGAAMGAAVQFFDLAPFLVTLAGMFGYRSLGLMISEESVSIQHGWYRTAGLWALDAVPPVAIMLLACGLIAWLVMRSTGFGRAVYAIGDHDESARLMGIPVGRTRIGVYAVSGLFSGLAGILSTVHMGSGDATRGMMGELDAIAAVVIGGTPLIGGRGSVIGTVAGVLILGLIQQYLMLRGVQNSWWVRIAVGVLLLAFILLQRLVATRVVKMIGRGR